MARADGDGPLRLCGLALLYDAPRPDSRRLIDELRALGVKVLMLTGDALPVAREIARVLGLGEIARAPKLQTGRETPVEVAPDLAGGGLAEVFPEDKFLVVKGLQAGGHVVGMTGDGVNDAPALRQAEVGIAVSGATDVAKGAASAVLTTEGLANIVDLVKSGRATYQRVLTWIVNKVSRSILKAGFVVIAFLVTGKFVISALVMLLVVCLTDVAHIALATDRVQPSPKPETWNIGPLVRVAVVLGVLTLIEALGLLAFGWHRFGLVRQRRRAPDLHLPDLPVLRVDLSRVGARTPRVLGIASQRHAGRLPLCGRPRGDRHRRRRRRRARAHPTRRDGAHLRVCRRVLARSKRPRQGVPHEAGVARCAPPADRRESERARTAPRRSAGASTMSQTSRFDVDAFRVPAGKKVDLKEWPTLVRPLYQSKKAYRKLLQAQVEELSALQELHYACNRFAVLLIFQAMDAAGKDGAIRHVMSGVNPQGCQVFSFKHPSATELQHDFLWRTTRSLPERGRIGIFNRSYYEEVLILRVHPEILRSEGLTDELLLDEKDVWRGRYESIVHLESHLHGNGTRIIKLFLHLSKEEQRKRFLERIDTPEKNWKFSLADIEERKFWKKYQEAYEACLGATSTKETPWYVVPADDKENARLIISEIVLDVFRKLKLTYPKSTANRRRELALIRKRLTKEA